MVMVQARKMELMCSSAHVCMHVTIHRLCAAPSYYRMCEQKQAQITIPSFWDGDIDLKELEQTDMAYKIFR